MSSAVVIVKVFKIYTEFVPCYNSPKTDIIQEM